MDSLDLEKLRLPDQGSGTPRAPERRVPNARTRGHFLKGPVPLSWLMAAANLPGKALAVGIAIWFRSGLTKSLTVSLPSTLLGLFGVDRSAKLRALRALEDARLIAVERTNGKNPLVTILAAPEDA